MRYNVGSVYPFIKVEFQASEPRFGNLYLPWCDTLKEIKVQLLECTAHHKVRSSHEEESAEPTCDGFVFRNLETQENWHNQYPTASYGQISCEADSRAHRSYEYFKKDASDKELDSFDNFEDAASFMSNICRGIMQLTVQHRLDEVQALERFLKQIQEEILKHGIQSHIAEHPEGSVYRRLGWKKITFSKVSTKPSN